MSTAEYAVGTVAACAFAAVLYRVVTGGSVVTGARPTWSSPRSRRCPDHGVRGRRRAARRGEAGMVTAETASSCRCCCSCSPVRWRR